jgi:hypothetical protein
VGFRVISQLSLNYRRSPLSQEGKPRLTKGPRAGDRFPDAPIRIDGRDTTIHQSLSSSGFQLLLCGPLERWAPPDDDAVTWPPYVTTTKLSSTSGPGVWTDSEHAVLRLLGIETGDSAHYVIRPDGHVGYRARGNNLAGAREYFRGL